MHPMRSTGVLVPVECLRAQRKRRAQDSEQADAMPLVEPFAASPVVWHAAPQTPPWQSDAAVPRSAAELAADVLARAGDDGDAAARFVAQQATLVTAAGLARVGLAGLGDAVAVCAATSCTSTGGTVSAGAASSDAVADARAAVSAARKKRPRNEAAIALPLAPADAPDKVASVSMRLGVQTGVYAAWKLFVAEKPASWLVTFANSLVSERPADRLAAFESAWEFVRDELINARRKRSLRVEGAHGLMMVTVVGYVRNMRHWLFPELFPELARRVSKGEWNSFWARLDARVEAEFSSGGQRRTGEQLQSGSLRSGATPVEALDVGRSAVEARREQTERPSTREPGCGIVSIYLLHSTACIGYVL